jgi:DNA repair protein RecN (Recombination protein N)
LSRIALAIAVCTAQADRHGAPTLVFDEVDAGVGGAVAHTVGRQMQQLGRQRQVLCVTHLAQVAAKADAHWLVSKEAGDQGWPATYERVQGEARTAEIARMLGGVPSGASLLHARELLA